MDNGRDITEMIYAYGARTLAEELAIRDSQVPVPIATEIHAQDSRPAGPSLKDAGIVGQILAGICVALVIAFLIIVALGQ